MRSLENAFDDTENFEEDQVDNESDFSTISEPEVRESEVNGDGNAMELFMGDATPFRIKKAERALEQMADNFKEAEEHLADELKRELRHERKDDPAVVSPNPVHIGQVVADAPSRQPGLSGVAGPQPVDDDASAYLPGDDSSSDADTPVEYKVRPSSTYRQAIGFGFGAALAVLAGLVLLNLLRSG